MGARTALGILSGISVEGFRQCVIDRDVVSLKRLPGIGHKTAERLLIEMADRLPVQESPDGIDAGETVNSEGEAHGALMALGYKPAEALRMLKNLDATRLRTEDLIREALKQIHDR